MTDNVLPTCTLIAQYLPVLTTVYTKHVVSHWDNGSFANLPCCICSGWVGAGQELFHFFTPSLLLGFQTLSAKIKLLWIKQI